ASMSAWLRSETSTCSSGSGSSPATKSPKTASSCSPTGWSRLADARAAARTSRACSTGSDASSAISSSVGSRPSSIQSVRSARFIFCSRSTMCTGMRLVRDLSASARATAWRLPHAAAVRLDHRLLREQVAALDLLRQLGLLRRGQERVLARLAQEELQRVGRRLVGGLERRGRRRLDLVPVLLRLLRDLDPAPVEL